jgi:Protein of unknown function (DUF3318)
MTDPTEEIIRLEDLLPASWRMQTKVIGGLERVPLISSTAPLPWNNRTKISLNLRLWSQLSRSQRDLVFLQEVAGRLLTRWVSPGIYQGLTLLALFGTVWQFTQSDLAGGSVGLLLILLSVERVKREQTGLPARLRADQESIRIAQKRGYGEKEAARSLLTGLEARELISESTAKGKSGSNSQNSSEFEHLIRCQNLRAIAGLSEVGIPIDLT